MLSCRGSCPACQVCQHWGGGAFKIEQLFQPLFVEIWMQKCGESNFSLQGYMALIFWKHFKAQYIDAWPWTPPPPHPN